MKASDNEFPSVLVTDRADDPSTPSTDTARLFIKDGDLYAILDSGAVVGPFSTGGGGGGSGVTTLLEEIVLGSDTTTVEFDGIAQTHSELRIEIVGRSTRAASNQDAPRIRFGNTSIDSGANYESAGKDSSLESRETGATSGQVCRFQVPGASYTADTFGAVTVHVPQYANTAMHKSFRAHGGFTGTDHRLGHSAGAWLSTSAIDIIHLFCANGDWTSGSVFRLYGIG